MQHTLDLFETLFAQHREVEQRSKALYSSCEQIVREKDQLQEFADALHAKLKCVCWLVWGKKGILPGMGCSGSERGGKAQARHGCRFEERGRLFRNGQQGDVL